MGGLLCIPVRNYTETISLDDIPPFIRDQFYLVTREFVKCATGVELEPQFPYVLAQIMRVGPFVARTLCVYGVTAATMELLSVHVPPPEPNMITSDDWARRNSKVYIVEGREIFKGARYFREDALKHFARLDLPQFDITLPL